MKTELYSPAEKAELKTLTARHQQTIDFIREIYGANLANKRMLDVGGRGGVVLRGLPESVMKINMDIDGESLLEVKGDRVVGDVSCLPFQDGSFDICILAEVLEHLAFPEKAIAEIYRVADEVILSTPNNCLLRKMVILPGMIIRREENIAGRLRGSRQSHISPQSHIREYGWREVKGLFEKGGFELKRFDAIECFLTKPRFLAHLVKFSPKLATKVLMWFKKKDW